MASQPWRSSGGWVPSLKPCAARGVAHAIHTMKTPLFLGLALLALVPAQAQIFRPAAVNGAILGGLAGAIIGHNSGSLHHNGWQGAAIGAGAGLLFGAATDISGYGYYGAAD